MEAKAIKTFAIVGLSLLLQPAFAQLSDPTKEGDERIAYNSEKALVGAAVADFLINTADGRLEGAKLAVKNGTSKEVRAYGFQMIREESLFMIELKELAASKRVALPESLSGSKENTRDYLAKLSGKDFDDKFIKISITDHERDLKSFREFLSYSNDADVSAFARKYIPVLESHLNKLRSIRKSQR